MTSRSFVICMVALCGAITSAATAQDRQVSASGTSTITAPPEILRVNVLLKTEGKEVKEALARLKTEEQSAREKLGKLNAPADSIKFSDPAMGEKPLTPQQRQMQMYMRGQNRGGKKPTTGPSRVNVTATLSADLPLKSASPEEMLIAVADLQAKLRESFKPAPKAAATPEEQEVLEEMQGAEEAASGTDVKPGEPAFLFVHVIGEGEQNKAIADAFAQAKRSAERLAKAAGAELGEIKTLNSTSTTGGGENTDAQTVFYNAMINTRPATGESTAVEATGPQPGPVSSRVTVNVAFGLK
jgi:uncharacterized protein YggE